MCLFHWHSGVRCATLSFGQLFVQVFRRCFHNGRISRTEILIAHTRLRVRNTTSFRLVFVQIVLLTTSRLALYAFLSLLPLKAIFPPLFYSV